MCNFNVGSLKLFTLSKKKNIYIVLYCLVSFISFTFQTPIKWLMCTLFLVFINSYIEHRLQLNSQHINYVQQLNSAYRLRCQVRNSSRHTRCTV